MGFPVVILKPKLLKDEGRSGDVIDDVKLLTRAASHRLHGTVLVRQSHKKIVRTKSKLCPEVAKKSGSEEFFIRHGPVAEEGPAKDFDISKSTIAFRS